MAGCKFCAGGVGGRGDHRVGPFEAETEASAKRIECDPSRTCFVHPRVLAPQNPNAGDRAVSGENIVFLAGS